MNAIKKENKEKMIEKNESIEQIVPDEKTCFIIMPIADHPDYPEGHFKRVYEYLIKPSCKLAGYKAIRADDSKASHMIMFDILKKIVDCDMAICDLTTKNANVFYELGLRQAFNKKTILITDGKEKAPFDIAGFRYVEYSSSLRADLVEKEIPKIAEMLYTTESDSENSINSIVKLLAMEPAKIESKELNNEESILFKMVMSVNEKIDRLSNKTTIKTNQYGNSPLELLLDQINLDQLYNLENKDYKMYNYTYWDSELGDLVDINSDEIYFNNNGNINIFKNDKMTRCNILVKPKYSLKKVLNG